MVEAAAIGAGRARQPIAVVGIGCRFPGAADGPRAFWQLLRDGVDAVGEIPRDRFDADALFDSRPGTPGKIASRRGGFLEHVDKFDAGFFGVSPREAERMDPQQRLLLEVSWEALEDAGVAIGRLTGSATGVFVGQWLDDYAARLFNDPAEMDFYSTIGTGRYSAAGRISYAFGLQGPSLAIDTACSSSLVAVHLACRSLWSGESDLALAAAANLILEPHITIAYSQSRMMAPDGHCKFGDARANGYVRSDGVGVVVLKPLRQALADRDRVYALVAGSAVNNDGRTSDYLATPGRGGQEDLLWKAYRDAGVAPPAVHYVEAHGTGTLAGDPVELGALGAVVGQHRPPGQACLVGSVKTNLGHTEGAAGLAGLIKTTLALWHREIPASLHFEQPNPDIAWTDLGLEINTRLRPWPDDGQVPTAGVSSFGIAGTNAHIVLRAAPAPAEAVSETPRPHVLVLSARSSRALAELAQAYGARLSEDTVDPSELCYTAAVRRVHHAYRLAVVGKNAGDLVEQLAAVEGTLNEASPRRVAFVFPGQGSQWPRMARGLLQREPAFREAIERCERAFDGLLGWSLREVLEDDAATVDRIDVVQPLLFAIQVGLAAVWRAWGIEPDAVVGHSMGEVAAAHVAGALTLEDGARVISLRSRLMRKVSGQGSMAVVDLGLEDARAALRGNEERLSVAVSNGPHSSVIAGDPEALDDVLEQLSRVNVFCRRVNVDVASHSPHMDPLVAELEAGLQGLQPRPATLPLVSTVLGGPSTALLDAAYWGRNLRAPVLFADAVQHLVASGITAFIELSPHPVLLTPISQALAEARVEGLALPSMRRDTDEQTVMLESLASLHVAGRTPAWERLYPSGRLVHAPSYPWQRERFWIEAPARTGARLSSAGTSPHAVLGERLQLADRPREHVWELYLRPTTHPRAHAHRLFGAAVLPASAILELATAVGREIYGDTALRIADVEFKRALALDETGTTLQLVAAPSRGQRTGLRLFRRTDEAWVLHATASIEPIDASSGALDRDWPTAERPAAQLYERFASAGVEFGEPLRGLADVYLDEDAGQALLAAENEWTLDPCLQLAAGMALSDRLQVPIRIDEVIVVDTRAGSGRVHARRSVEGGVDVAMVDDNGGPRAVLRGIRMQPAAASTAWLHTPRWRPVATRPAVGVSGTWLVLGDAAGIGVQLVRRLTERGAACAIEASGSEVDVRGPLAGIVDLRAIDVPDTAQSCARAVELIRAVERAAEPSPSRIWLVTRGAQAPLSDSAATGVLQAGVWGLGQVLATEHPDLFGGLIDLDLSEASALAAERLFAEIAAGPSREPVALHAGQRFVRVLEPTLEPSPGQLDLRRDASYLITGGLGSIGLQIARWLAEQGARRIILMSRTPLPARETWLTLDGTTAIGRAVSAVREVERLGASVEPVSIDVADEAALRGWLARERAEGRPPIRGLVHAAGVVEDRLLAQLDEAALRRVLRGKADGAMALHHVLGDVDFFVLFSSIGSLVGLAGQASYAAANAVLDALAHHRRAAGLPALSINWGPWHDQGFAASSGGREALRQLAEDGYGSIESRRALELLGSLLDRALRGAPDPQVAVLPRTRATEPPHTSAHDTTGGGDQETGYTELLNLPHPQRRGALQTRVREHVARVVKLPAARVDPTRTLGSMGIDSLMGQELRRRLEADLGVSLSATLVWNFPTVAALVPHLATKMSLSLEDEMPAAPAAEVPRADGVDVETMSDEEALAQLIGLR